MSTAIIIVGFTAIVALAAGYALLDEGYGGQK